MPLRQSKPRRMLRTMKIAAASLFALSLAACHSNSGANLPGDPSQTQPYAGVGHREVLHFVGTEPFWGGQVADGVLVYTTPEDQNGSEIAVKRFAGRGGLSFSGVFEGKPFDLMVTEGKCSDGMSDRSYPFAVTLKVMDGTRYGCAWSASKSQTVPEHS